MTLRMLLPLVLASGPALPAQDRAPAPPPLTEFQKSTLHKEVAQVVLAWIQAQERADARAVLAYYAALPEFPLMYADSEGRLMDFEAFQKRLHDSYEGAAPCTITPRKEMLAVLDAETVLWSFQGAWRGTLRLEPPLQMEACAMSLLIKRVAGEWKIVYQHESHPTSPKVP
ncbi:hypothetical protein GETHLI_14600 [Geothrix limicola]|uniref:SnoaL-like domain-containing protein n=1 Tax=Geothrix limicola TaxID=2927978 RepID=A0ABQ5QF19_9BACT|nr:nuclear transport factor 2 family protein [Geothrix limicola]GLH72958.1 hypothetical protein GETHLI_14600 [Geothrix limicola]